MRWTLISFLCIFTFNLAWGQQQTQEDRAEGISPINIGLDEVKRAFTPPANRGLKSAAAKKCNINISYIGFPENLKPAFEYAISLWEQKITSSVPINVVAKWEKLERNILALSRPSFFYKDFIDAPLANVYYPVALAEKLSEKEINDPKEADIICCFNSVKPWYYGMDGKTPTDSYDFVTTVLHEITHGLGVSGFLTGESGMGSFNNMANAPSAYDYYIFNAYKQRISDNSIFKSPSASLFSQLTSGKLDFCATENNQTVNHDVYAPTNWRSGASIYHLEEGNFCEGDGSALMTPYAYKGEAIHNPGNTTMEILNEIGWDLEAVKFAELKDVENTAENLAVRTSVSNVALLNLNSVQVVFSTNYFKSKDSVTATFNSSKQLFEASLPLHSHKGKVQYYFRAKTADKQSFTFPKLAPRNILNFKIGPDYYPPALQHNPAKLVNGQNPSVDFVAIASDNMGVGAVSVEYTINGKAQEPFFLTAKTEALFTGNLHLPKNLNANDRLEYRIFAEDCSSRKNKKCLPTNGSFKIEVFETYEAVPGFFTDFDNHSNDFTANGFEVARPVGFSNSNLHTENPYPQSEIEDDRCDLIAQLKYPIIVETNGQISYDEIVLVEPGKEGTHFTDAMFCDYVIVEATKNNGLTWEPLTDGYDSRINQNWETTFASSLKSSASSASGHENMFWQHTINITESGAFSNGDVILIRFRLAADKSINGWGWAIDNLKIQNPETTASEVFAKTELNFYPNPVANNLFIECNDMLGQTSVEIAITDLAGKTVLHETNYDIQFNPKLKINLSNIQPGIYLASITDENFNTTTKKIIKN